MYTYFNADTLFYCAVLPLRVTITLSNLLCFENESKTLNPQLDRAFLEVVRKKHRCWQRYFEIREPENTWNKGKK